MPIKFNVFYLLKNLSSLRDLKELSYNGIYLIKKDNIIQDKVVK